MDGVEIEIFRADTRASKGLTATHIQEAASLYDPEKAPAPLVFGHPTTDSPALGVVDKVRVEGSKMYATLKGVADELVKAVRDRRVINRSVAFWDPHHPSNPNPGKFSLRHLGFLGGQAPAIANMPALRFSADDSALESDEAPADAIIFAAEEAGTGVQTVQEAAAPAAPKGDDNVKTAEQLQAELDAATARADAAEKAKADAEKTFAAAEKTRREGENKATVDAAVAAGKVLPAEAEDLAKIFNALPVEALTFAAGDLEPRAALASFIDKLPKRAPVNDPAKTPTHEFNAEDAKAKSDAALSAANEGLGNAWKGPKAA